MSPLATMARLDVFEGDVYQMPPMAKNQSSHRAFVWSVGPGEKVTMYEMPDDSRTQPRRWTVTVGFLRAKCRLLEANGNLRRKVA